MTEKRFPTYDIQSIKAVFNDVNRLVITKSAATSAAEMGFESADVVATIQTIERSHFYKSMTSNYDIAVWQDVYHVPSRAGLLYVKFTASGISGFKLLSFKEK